MRKWIAAAGALLCVVAGARADWESEVYYQPKICRPLMKQ